MITTGSKLWFGLAGLAVVAAVAYLVFSEGEGFGLLVLLGLFLAAGLLGIVTVVLRDGDVPAAAAGAPARGVPVPLPSAWPALAALGLGVTAVGAAVGGVLLYVGFALLAVTVVEWMVQAWAERSTGDPAYNASLRNRIMLPFEVPVLGLLGAAAVLYGFSRVLLALPKSGSTIVAIVVAAVVLGVAALIATRPRVSASLAAGAAVVGSIALLAGGVVGAVAGERDIEPHEGAEHEAEGAAEGAAADHTITMTPDGLVPTEVTVPVGEPVRIRFVNEDADNQPHSLQIQGVEGESSTGEVASGEEKVIEIVAPRAGDYTFIELPRPDESAGRLIAVDAAELEGTGGSSTVSTEAP